MTREQRRHQLARELAQQPAFFSPEVERAIDSLSLPAGSLSARELDAVARTLTEAKAISAERTRLRIAALLDGAADDDGAVARDVELGVAREEQLDRRQELIALLRRAPAGMSPQRRAWEIDELNRRIRFCRRGNCCWDALDFDDEPAPTSLSR